MALLCGLERAHTFLVPIINPPFADTARTLFHLNYPVFSSVIY